MLTRIVEFSLRFRGIVIALACLALVYGVFVTLHAKLDAFPEFAPPQVVIQTEAPGLSSEQVETLITQRIENELIGTSRLDVLRSQSIQGLSVITAIFQDNTDIYRDRQMVSERIIQVANEMPAGVSIPIMAPLTSTTSVILSIGLSSTRVSPIDLWTFAYWTVRPRLLSVPGVAKVAIYGGGMRQLQVQIDSARLVAYALGINDVLTATRNATGVRGGGFVENQNQRIVVQSYGQSLTPEELGDAVVRYREGGSVRLRDVARIAWAAAPQIGDATIRGRNGVILLVSSQYRANTLEVTGGADQALTELAGSFKQSGITVYPRLFRAADFIDTAVGDMRSSLFIGGLLVAIVLALFLYNFRTSFISLTAIPLSLLAAVIVLDRMGISLNTLTLGGLAIAIGEVVDDAIIDVENIFRRLRENHATPKPLLKVVLDASIEVRSAVVYATFVVALVFLPVLNMSGVQGALFAPLGLAYILAIMASLGVALTLTPALCMVMLPGATATEETALVTRLKAAHARWLEAAFRRPGLVIGVAVAAVLVAVAVLPFFGGSFLPELKERSFVLHMTGMQGASLSDSVRIGDRITRKVLHDPDIDVISQRVGRAILGDDTLGPQDSEFDVRLKPNSSQDIDTVQSEIRGVLAQFPGYQFSMNSFLTERIEETISGETTDVTIKMFGDDLDLKASQVAAVLRRIPGAVDVRVVSPGGMPEFSVRLRPGRLVQLGYQPLDLLNALETAYQGAVAAQIYDGNRSFDVSVILNPSERQDAEAVGMLMVRNGEGALYPVHELASLGLSNGRYAILHESARRLQIVTCNVRGRDVQSFDTEANRAIASGVRLPPGAHLAFTGAAQARAQGINELLLNSLIAGVVILSLLYIALGNLPNLLLILANVPFALVGGVIAVLFTGGYLSLGSMVGFVTLFGITARNALMLISHYEHLVKVEGMEWGKGAALRGASERLLPILMTALVTGLGLLPLAIGSGAPGREIEGPMAIIILGGLITSTALNLLVLPSLALRYGRFEKPAPNEVL